MFTGKTNQKNELLTRLIKIETVSVKRIIKEYKSLDQENKGKLLDYLMERFAHKYIVKYTRDDKGISILTKDKFEVDELSKYLLLA